MITRALKAGVGDGVAAVTMMGFPWKAGRGGEPWDYLHARVWGPGKGQAPVTRKAGGSVTRGGTCREPVSAGVGDPNPAFLSRDGVVLSSEGSPDL